MARCANTKTKNIIKLLLEKRTKDIFSNGKAIFIWRKRM